MLLKRKWPACLGARRVLQALLYWWQVWGSRAATAVQRPDERVFALRAMNTDYNFPNPKLMAHGWRRAGEPAAHEMHERADEKHYPTSDNYVWTWSEKSKLWMISSHSTIANK